MSSNANMYADSVTKSESNAFAQRKRVREVGNPENVVILTQE